MKNSQEILGREHRLGLGGVPIGTAFEDISEEKSMQVMETAWENGIRYFDTSPWYGLTKGERRFGKFLTQKNRDEFVFSTKIGRLFTEVDEEDVPPTMWKSPLNYDFRHDYSADATKKSIEDSLKRTGLDYIDIIFVHDLSEDQVGDRYDYFLEQAKEGAFKVLSDLRNEGVIKAWGMGVNKIKPVLDCMESADPDICLSATQYSILEHAEAVEKLLPEVKKNGVKLVSGAGFNSGFIGGKKRYNYKKDIPLGMEKKFEVLEKTCKKYDTDPITAAIHFVLAADDFVSIIPGMSKESQVIQNMEAMDKKIDPAFWKELKELGIIYDKAQVPE